MKFLGRLKIRQKLGLLLGLSALSLAAMAGVGASVVHDKLMADREIQTHRLVQVALDVVKSWHAKEVAGTLTRDQAQAGAIETLRPLRFGDGDYFFVQNYQGLTLLNDPKRELEGKERLNAKDPDGVPNVLRQIEAAKSGGGIVYYRFPRPGSQEPIQKVSYAGGFDPWQWAICTGVYVDDIEAEYRATLWRLSIAVLGIILVTSFITWLISRDIANSLVRLKATMERLAGGDLASSIDGTDRRDEIGGMARTVEVFKDNMIETEHLRAEQEELKKQAEEQQRQAMFSMADAFEMAVGDIVRGVSLQTTELQATAQSMSATAEETERQSTAVAAASEEASTNVQTVASAAEELSSSIAEISRQVATSSDITARAVEDTRRTNEQIQGLAEAAQSIGDVVKLISDIASQTNLLALNATIEAARAGDAGKGFAVVASEVKSLASQTAKATEEISSKITEMQTATSHSVTAVQEIGQTIARINEIATTIASAVEEQGAATQEIARNVQQASAGTTEVSMNIAGVTRAANDTGAASTQVLATVGELTRQSEALRSEVENFLANIRAA
jgi:methyl-accepting chemotaxis protein